MTICSVSRFSISTPYPSRLLHPRNHQQTTLTSLTGFDMDTRSTTTSTVFGVIVISTSSQHESIKYHSSIISLPSMISGGETYLNLERTASEWSKITYSSLVGISDPSFQINPHKLPHPSLPSSVPKLSKEISPHPSKPPSPPHQLITKLAWYLHRGVQQPPWDGNVGIHPHPGI